MLALQEARKMAKEETKDFNAMLHRDTDMPKIQIITDPAVIQKYGGEKMYFAPPLVYDEIMRSVPRGKLLTVGHIRAHLARKNGQVTNFGKFMDPLADKLLVTTALICFVQVGQIPAWAAIIVVGRDLAVDGLRMVAASRNIVMAAGWSGKIKTGVTMIAVCVMIVFGEREIVNQICAGLILLLNVVSLIDYFHANGRVLMEGDD